MVALDFDQTIVEVHTGGRWKGGEEALANHVRPEFKCFIEESLQVNIAVAVATFSGQTELIHKVLKQSIKHENAEKIPVYGLDSFGFDRGKHSQLMKAVTDVGGATPDTTVLVDDDSSNTRLAESEGYMTLTYDPDIDRYPRLRKLE